MGVLNLSEDVGADTLIPNKSLLAILIFILFAISGGALEFAFSIKPMFDTIQQAGKLDLDSSSDIEESDSLLLHGETILDDASDAPYHLVTTSAENPVTEEKVNSTFNGLKFFDTPPSPTQASKQDFINEQKMPVAPQVYINNNFR